MRCRGPLPGSREVTLPYATTQFMRAGTNDCGSFFREVTAIYATPFFKDRIPLLLARERCPVAYIYLPHSVGRQARKEGSSSRWSASYLEGAAKTDTGKHIRKRMSTISFD